MNPYKNSLLSQIKGIESLTVYNHMKSAGEKNNQLVAASNNAQAALLEKASEKQIHHRKRRFLEWLHHDPDENPEKEEPKKIRPQTYHKRRSRSVSIYEPVKAHCQCDLVHNKDCVPLKQQTSRSVICYCFRDKTADSLWPCYRPEEWSQQVCESCEPSNKCKFPKLSESDASEPTFMNYTRMQPCICLHNDMICVIRPFDIYLHGAAVPTSTPSPDLIQKYGMNDVSDDAALTAKAKESIVYEMANIDIGQRINISYTLDDMIYECSFDNQPCNIEEDFQRRVTPAFGNCYGFNSQPNSNRTTSRSGPNYGLRVLAYADVTDYLPTTDAAGFRIAIHQCDEYPFPDAIGYNAPTGIISAFALKLKTIKRLSEPYGNCLKSGSRPQNYIYKEKYTTEGCYRSCLQNAVIRECECGDPRLPDPSNSSFCHLMTAGSSSGNSQKGCVDRVYKESAGGSQIEGCECKQPCDQSSYIITYSAARWPAAIYDPHDCKDGKKVCLLDYRTNAAFLEIYYEQSNYEVAEEREAYGMTSLIADFGGQLGLWMGFSVITILEWLILIFKLITVCCRPRSAEKKSSLTDSNGNREYLESTKQRFGGMDYSTPIGLQSQKQF